MLQEQARKLEEIYRTNARDIPAVRSAFKDLLQVCSKKDQKEMILRREIMYLVDVGKMTEAMELMKSLSKESSHAPRSMWPLGDAYLLYRADRVGEALEYLQRTFQNVLQDLHAKSFDGLTQQEVITIRHIAAQCMYRNCDYEGASALFVSLSEMETMPNVELWVNYVAALGDSKQCTTTMTQAMIQALQRQLSTSDPQRWYEQNPDLIVNVALALMHAGDSSQAVELIHKAAPHLSVAVMQKNSSSGEEEERVPLRKEDAVLCCLLATAYHTMGENKVGKKYNDLVLSELVRREEVRKKERAAKRKRNHAIPEEGSVAVDSIATNHKKARPPTSSGEVNPVNKSIVLQIMPRNLCEALCISNSVELSATKAAFDWIVADAALSHHTLSKRCTLLQLQQHRYNQLVTHLQIGNNSAAVRAAKTFQKEYPLSEYAMLIRAFALLKAYPNKPSRAEQYLSEALRRLLSSDQANSTNKNCAQYVPVPCLRFRMVLLLAELRTSMQRPWSLVVDTLAFLPVEERYCHNVLSSMIWLLSHPSMSKSTRAQANVALYKYLKEASEYWRARPQDKRATSATLATLIQLGQIQMERRHFAEACETYQKLAELAPDKANVARWVHARIFTDPLQAVSIAENLEAPAIPSDLTCEALETEDIPKLPYSPSSSQPSESILHGSKHSKRQKRRREAALAKTDGKNPPDPERWLPIRDRPSLKGKGKKVLLKMAQERREYSNKKYAAFLARSQGQTGGVTE